MEALSYKTVSASKETVNKGWILIDAEDQILGRLGSKVAYILRGKVKTNFTPHVDTGDYIVVINAEKVHVTGKKLTDKIYYHHTNHIGGIKSISFKHLVEKSPTSPIEIAVKGMLPRGPLGRAMLRKLKVYAGNEHPHTAQQPKELTI